MKAKDILYDIMCAFCLDTQNTNAVIKLAGIKANIFNGKRDWWKIRKLLIRAIPEEKAKEIINAMPFPFVERYYPKEAEAQKHYSPMVINYPFERDSVFFMREVLAPIKVGEIKSVITGYGFHVRKRRG